MISFSKIFIHGNCMDFFSGYRIIRLCQNDFGDVISDFLGAFSWNAELYRSNETRENYWKNEKK